mmetsp:Transcript_11309/g.17121  ORF Transcript_11309/g.17121 Transcript_11309/m.17121 type:complete len:471 (-) Transcript_11309:1061-2473(-)
MLSGIKKGKRKRRSNADDSSKVKRSSGAPPSSSSVGSHVSNGGSSNRIESVGGDDLNSGSNNSKSSAKNHNAAEELRRMLAGVSGTKNVLSGSIVSANTATKKSESLSPLERFEQRRGTLFASIDGNGSKGSTNNDDGATQEETVVLMANSCSSTATKTPVLSKEDFRRGARKGKVKQKESYMRSNADQTITEMVEEEKRSRQQGNQDRGGMDEVFARNVARMGSRYKASDFKMVAGSTAGADEDDGTSMDMKMFTSVSDRLTDAEKYNRDVSRQLALSRKQNAITNKCWWWIESETFQKHRLISLGDHVSLVLVPSHLQLVPNQLFLVPVNHAEAFVSCEDEVWDEVQRFKTSLRAMFKKEHGMGLLFCETVLPTKTLWQARMDVVPVPLNVEQDAQMFFKSALTEQAEEWGTHTKLLTMKGNKGLRQTIPKGFNYFSIEWEGGGFAQIIETSSFPKDFGIDTIAGKQI